MKASSILNSKDSRVYFVDSNSTSFFCRQFSLWLSSELRDTFKVFPRGIDFVRKADELPPSVLLIFNLDSADAFRDLSATLKQIQATDRRSRCRIVILDFLEQATITRSLVTRGYTVITMFGEGLQSLKPKIERQLNHLQDVKLKSSETSQQNIGTRISAVDHNASQVSANKSEVFSLFKPIQEPKKIEALLKRATQEKRPIRVWTKGGHAVLEGKLSSERRIPEQVSIQVKDPEQVKAICDEFRRAPDQKLLGNFNLRSGAVFLTGKEIRPEKQKNLVQLEIEPKLYQVQRRKQDRMPIPANADISVRVDRFPLSLVNLGLGGVEVLLDRPDHPAFHVGDIVSMELQIHDRKMVIDSKICWIKSVEKSEGLMATGVGFRFENLKTIDAAYLRLFLFELAFEQSGSNST